MKDLEPFFTEWCGVNGFDYSKTAADNPYLPLLRSAFNAGYLVSLLDTAVDVTPKPIAGIIRVMQNEIDTPFKPLDHEQTK